MAGAFTWWAIRAAARQPRCAWPRRYGAGGTTCNDGGRQTTGLKAWPRSIRTALLCLDELAQLDAKVAGESAYMLANGQGKSRAGRTGAARPRLTWRLLFLSAGEIGLAEHMAEANKRTRAGQELRMIDLPADAGAASRASSRNCTTHDSGGAMAQHLTRATELTFGTAGRAWLEYLTANTEGLTRTLRERMDKAEAHWCPRLRQGQVQRVGRRFAWWRWPASWRPRRA